MPIYAYKCSACGHAKDVLQKISDDPLTDCPACHAATLTKQLTAAGFQLKGSGWYATDFKGGSNAPPPAADAPAAAPEGGASTVGAPPSSDAKAAPPASTSEGANAATSSSTPSAAACGASCACH